MKSRKSTKIFVAIFAMIGILGITAACGQDAADGGGQAAQTGQTGQTGQATPGQAAGDQEELYELLFLRDHDVSASEAAADRNIFRNYVRDNFNIVWENMQFVGDMQERLMVDLAGGTFPDIINPRNTQVLQAYAAAGALLNLGELLESYAPNVLSRHANRLPFWQAMSGMNDGNIWAMTMWEPNEMGARAMPELQWLIRSDILEQQGFPQILDENDLFEVLQRGLAENPTTNGQPTVAFSHPLNAWGTDGLRTLTYTYNMGRLSHTTANRGMVFDFYANQFIDVTTDHAYRNGLEFFNRLWREGLFDRDSVTDSWESFESKMRQGIPLAAYFLVWPWDYDFNLALAAADMPFRYVPFTFQLSSQRERNETMIYPQGSGEVWSSIAITTNARFPERLVRLMDWQATDEGMILAGWGREGVEFTIQDGRRVPTDEFFHRWETDPEYQFELFAPAEFGFFLGVDDNGQSFRISHDTYVVNRALDPIVRSVWNAYGWENSFDMYFNNANFNFSVDHFVGLKTAFPTLTDTLHRNWEMIDVETHGFTMQLVTADSPEAFDQIFENMLARRADLGQAEIVELWNAEYQEMRVFFGFD
ncbi:MAG: hypothetical protein FWG68_10130 [Defluviitaleaceae bacterium]|nr:hypothetical protein [Defluviitaleaceae bacterium]